MPTTLTQCGSIGAAALALVLCLSACDMKLATPGANPPPPGATVAPSQKPRPTVRPSTAPTAPVPRPSPTPSSAPTTPPVPSAKPTTVPTAPPTAAPPTASPTTPPSSDTPGVPPGTRLTRLNGDLVITRAGTVISNTEIRGRVSIKAANVTIKNSRIRAQHPTSVGVVNTKAHGVVIKDSEILSDHRNPHTNGIMGSNFTLERVQIHSVVDQVHVFGAGNVTIRDSWLHGNVHYAQDPNWGGKPSHDDNIQVTGGADILVEGTKIEDAHNAAIMLGQDAGKISNVALRDNTIGGGACSINIAQKSHGPLTGLSIARNAFLSGTQRLAGCAVIAPLTYKTALSANVWEQTGSAVTLTRG